MNLCLVFLIVFKQHRSTRFVLHPPSPLPLTFCPPPRASQVVRWLPYPSAVIIQRSWALVQEALIGITVVTKLI